MSGAPLAYARRGLPVLPLWWTDDAGRCACGAAPGACKPGKHPKGRLAPHGVKDATIGRRTVEAWWRRQPKGNVGIATGGAMRLLVIDIDPDAGGEASFAAHEREHGAVPATVEAVTPRGGRHLYLLVPPGRPMPGNTAGKLGEGVDTRGQGGYVAAPPSKVGARAYSWSVDCADQFAEAPGWLLDHLKQGGGNGKATPPEEWQRIALEGVEHGARNQTIARVAGLLFRRLPDPILAAELVACFNAVKCRPQLGAEELKRTIDSIAAAEMRRRTLA
jgi:hypothetical protein